MGLFEKIFGKKKNQPEKKENQEKKAPPKQNNFITNSAEFGLEEITLGISGKVRVDGILAIAAMEKIAKQRNEEFSFQVMYVTLMEEGALTLPVVCSIGDENYALYFIYQEEELLKYKDLVNHIDKTEYPNLIYFSSIPIYDGYTPKKIIEPFQLADLRVDTTGKFAGRFAMWWSTEDEPFLHKSKSYELWTKWYEVTKGYETYLAGYVLRQTRVIKEIELKRLRLPQEHSSYLIEAPEGKKVILSISQEKGIRFLFPVNGVNKTYIERFLRGALVDLLAHVVQLKHHNVPQDEIIDGNSFDWFNFMGRVITEKEQEGEKMSAIGMVDFNSNLN